MEFREALHAPLTHGREDHAEDQQDRCQQCGSAAHRAGRNGGAISWEQLRDIGRENREHQQQLAREGPRACPNDGEPLHSGPDGKPFCPYDGWRPE